MEELGVARRLNREMIIGAQSVLERLKVPEQALLEGQRAVLVEEADGEAPCFVHDT